MVLIGKGNLLRAQADALVNTVNCVGVMGRGVALQFRKAFPENYEAYAGACKRGEVKIGEMFVVAMPLLDTPKFIINFPTKRHWREASKLEYIDAGLEDLVKVVVDNDIKSIALPPLGCGLGGLRWSDVRPRIERALGVVDGLEVTLYEPDRQVEPKAIINRTHAPRMTAGNAIVLALMGRYLQGLLDPYVTLLEVHKLMYFMQAAGQPLSLKFAKGPYGPYAENLRHMLIRMDGHYITGYGDRGDDPRSEIVAMDKAVPMAGQVVGGDARLLSKFNRVEQLIDGYETPFGLELLATVHWVAVNQHAKNPADALHEVHSWNKRKQVFSDKHVATAWSNLKRNDWLPFAS